MDPRCAIIAEKCERYGSLVTSVTEGVIARVLREEGAPYTLCITDYKILSAVAAAMDSTVSMTEIARQLCLHPSSATRRVRHLAECGLVIKEQDENDDRRYFLSLTGEGVRLLGCIDSALLAGTERMYAAITDEELQAVSSFMDKCVGYLSDALDRQRG